jgi:uncharacterized membrane protein SpoIIM required for sporulation
MVSRASMTTPYSFERLYEEDWRELETLLERLRETSARRSSPLPGARFAALYRRTCEHLALARARSYPQYLIARLDRITSEAHQAVYYRREFGIAHVRRMIAVDFPAAVRAHRYYVLAATAIFLLPAVIVGLLVYRQPELILTVVDADTAASFQDMYSTTARSIGRTREASTDWVMFGFYIRNNIGVAFQCFAGGLFAGLGTLFFLAMNGVYSGALAGYLSEHGLASTFYGFVVTHAAFELTAIVLAGAAGLRIGHSVIAPGRLTRLQSLVSSAADAVVLVYGVSAMLLVAAAIEAFWSSASWIHPSVKYSVAAICWIAVFGYFMFQGRRVR